MSDRRAHEMYTRLKATAEHWPKTSMHPYTGQPFKALIAAMLSAQTREEATAAASEALFAFAPTPEAVLDAGREAVRDAIRPASFYERKADYIMGIASRLLDVDGGEVPNDVQALMAYPGVGFKVATLVRYIAYGTDENIVVDTHVDRIGKRLGLIEPEMKGTAKIAAALEDAIPREYWGEWNELMVLFGREVCLARGPRCDTCPLRDLCPRVGLA